MEPCPGGSGAEEEISDDADKDDDAIQYSVAGIVKVEPNVEAKENGKKNPAQRLVILKPVKKVIQHGKKPSLLRIAKGVQVDAELLAFFVEVAALEAEGAGDVGHVEVVATDFGE
jgi:hypothetical protein